MDKVKLDVHVDIFSADVVCDLGNEDTAFVLAPAENLADETKSVGLDAHGHMLTLVAADFFHAWVLGPRADGDLPLLVYCRVVTWCGVVL
jgi:hypothetical protein